MSSRPFDSGVASGDPTTTSVVLWARTTAGPAPVGWEVGTDGGGVLATGSVEGPDGSDGTVRVRVEGLPPATALWYRFSTSDGSRSATGRTATLPTAPDRLRIGVACCGDWTGGPFDGYRWVARERPDIVLHIGDYVYEHGDRGRLRQHDPPRPCASGDDYRRRYRQYRTDPDLLALHAAAPWFSLWDDHEFATGAWTGRRPRRRSTGVADAARRDAAIEANLAWLPRDPSTATSRSLDRHRRLGDLLDLVLVDCRLGRHRPVDEAEGPRLAPRRAGRPMLADHQWAWLEDVLGGPAPRWTVLVSSVQVSPLRLAGLPGWAAGRPTVRPLVNPDQWDGHPADRDRLMALLAPRAGSVLLVSGDLHGRFLTGCDAGAGHIPELTVPSVSAASFARLVQRRLPLPRRTLEWWLRRQNPHVVDLDLGHHGAAVLDVGADRLEVRTGPAAPTRHHLDGAGWAT